MIKGELKKGLTMDSILELITPFDIYRKFYGDFDLNGANINHFRGEKNGSLIIGNKYGHMSHFDMGDSYWRGDCFNLVKQIHSCDLDTALRIIDREFGLGLTNAPIKDYKKEVSVYEQPEVTKRNTLIQVVTRKFTKEELSYWNDYYQDITDLRNNNIYSMKTLYLNRKRFPLKETELRFAYLYDGYFKIYRPYASKKDKWFPNNTPITKMDGLDKIKNCDTAFIGKSKKDHMVISKVFPCSCAVQNEGIACFSEENVNYLKSNSKRQILSFDADGPGVKNSQQITQLFGFDYCNVPKKYLEKGIKDWSDMAKAYDLKEVEKVLKEYKII